MHKLCRPELPSGIANSLHEAEDLRMSWDEYDKKAVRAFLRSNVQAGLCAYCESKLSQRDSQTRIDHFIPRSSEVGKEKVFDWKNLFLSCDALETCDSHKRNDERKIVNPELDDPRDYLTFTSTGAVIPVSGLDGDELLKANNTIDVLNLKSPLLCNRRVLAFNRLRKYADRAHVSFAQGVPCYFEFCTFCNVMLSAK